jgi:hypothetical protein
VGRSKRLSGVLLRTTNRHYAGALTRLVPLGSAAAPTVDRKQPLPGAGEMIASSSPQLSGLPPQAEPVPQNAPKVIGLDSRTASSPDQQGASALLDLGVVRQSINQIAASIASSQGRTDRMVTTQDQIARNFRPPDLLPRRFVTQL